MKKLYIILGLVLIISAAAASVYALYYVPRESSEPTPSAIPTPTASSSAEPTTSTTPTASPSESATPTSTPEPTATPTSTSVTVVDNRGVSVTVKYPVQRIVSIEAGITEIICALGGEDTIIGIQSSTVNWPKSVNNVDAVGSSGSMDVNVELILDLNPDLVVASSSLLNNNQTVAAIETAGIPLYIDASNIPNRVSAVVTNFGEILGNPEKAEEIISAITYYNDLIDQRIQNIPSSERTLFFAPMSAVNSYAYGNGSQFGSFLVSCGGVNIAENLSISYPQLSYEFILTADPEVIVVMASSITTNETVYQTGYDTIMNDSMLSTLSAVQNDRVHIYNYWLTGGIEYPVGKLYFAKMLYPDLFADIDPGSVYQQLIQKYFGETPAGVYFYP